ncbi:MAG: hypothetical protein RQ753_05810 [Desulfurivibrionaceae bacterium]|nr:hypothetical protein [Desulfurivibrionaceae bacterium]
MDSGDDLAGMAGGTLAACSDRRVGQAAGRVGRMVIIAMGGIGQPLGLGVMALATDDRHKTGIGDEFTGRVLHPGYGVGIGGIIDQYVCFGIIGIL